MWFFELSTVPCFTEFSRKINPKQNHLSKIPKLLKNLRWKLNFGANNYSVESIKRVEDAWRK